jgi:hypothetical protein
MMITLNLGVQGTPAPTGQPTFSAREWFQVGADIDGESSGDNFGVSVSMSSDGSRVAIGGNMNDCPSYSNAGHVRVFEYDSSSWVQLGSDIDGEWANDEFGWSVSLSADGDRVAIGGYLNDDGGGGQCWSCPRV